MADESGSGTNKKQCSKAHSAKLELAQIIMTLFKNFVVLGSMFLILHIHNAGKIGLSAAIGDGKSLLKSAPFLIILTLMLTFLSVIDIFIYNNLMLGLGLGMGVAVIALLYPDIASKGTSVIEEVVSTPPPVVSTE